MSGEGPTPDEILEASGENKKEEKSSVPTEGERREVQAECERSLNTQLHYLEEATKALNNAENTFVGDVSQAYKRVNPKASLDWGREPVLEKLVGVYQGISSRFREDSLREHVLGASKASTRFEGLLTGRIRKFLSTSFENVSQANAEAKEISAEMRKHTLALQDACGEKDYGRKKKANQGIEPLVYEVGKFRRSLSLDTHSEQIVVGVLRNCENFSDIARQSSSRLTSREKVWIDDIENIRMAVENKVLKPYVDYYRRAGSKETPQ